MLLPDDDYDYPDSTAVRNELKEQCRDLQLDNLVGIRSGEKKLPTRPRNLQKISAVPIYAVDEMVRNAPDLQATENMRESNCLRVNLEQAQKLGLEDAQQVHVKQGEGTTILPLQIDEAIPAGCVWIPSGIKAVKNLTSAFGSVEVEKVS